MSTIIKTPTDSDRESAAAEVRAELLRRAETEGVKAFTSLDDFAGDPSLTAEFDVDAFLRQVREDRERSSNGNSR
jgi:hypothetical protein